jgi:hypothetical protein
MAEALAKLEDGARIDEQLRVNVVQPDGGDLELLSVTDDGTVTIRLHGSCVGRRYRDDRVDGGAPSREECNGGLNDLAARTVRTV